MANKPEIIDEIERLAVHCRPPLMEASARAGWLADWCSDLADFPIETIRLAIRDWRHAGSGKFPTPGQLLPLIRSKLPAERKGKVEVWRPVSDDEYRAMDLPEKIRHHRIMAQECGRKAGPMWRNQPGSSVAKPMPGHINPEDMPDSYRRWRDQRDRHLAEAKRLTELLRAGERAA